MGLCCSVRCPGGLILAAYDAACALRDAEIPVVSGFHSPVERDCLRLLLRGKQPVVVCAARSLEGLRIPAEWKRPMAEGRLRLVSPFGAGVRRPSAAHVEKRNRMLVEMAHCLLVVYAEPGGRTEALCREALSAGKAVLALADEANAQLFAAGAEPVTVEGLVGRLEGLGVGAAG